MTGYYGVTRPTGRRHCLSELKRVQAKRDFGGGIGYNPPSPPCRLVACSGRTDELSDPSA